MVSYQLRNAPVSTFPCPEGMEPSLHALLMARGITSPEEAERFLNPCAEDLNDPFALSDMDRAVGLIRDAQREGRPVCVYGDYDVDGVSASAIVADHLRALGLNVRVYIPSRHTEGYGLNEAAVRDIAATSGLLVTVDLGVTNLKEVALARSLGLQVVVTDHHRPGPDLPDCPVVNPLLAEYPFRWLCGAGVAFKLVEALSGREAALEYVDIAALATVADIVSLTGENRTIVKLGLERINARPRPGIRALLVAADLEGRTISAGHIAFQLAPRLNAGGRLGDAMRSHELLLAKDDAAAQPLASQLEEENTRRRSVEAQILKEAGEQIAQLDLSSRRALILAGRDWNPGVIGLSAGKLCETWHMPTILFSEKDGVLTGSCRSIPGVDIHDALTSVKDLLTRYGGHKQAAGLTMPLEHLNAFTERIERWMTERCDAACWIPSLNYDLEAPFESLTQGFVAALDALQPTGYDNPAPVFRAKGAVVDARPVGRDGAHLRLSLLSGGMQLPGIWFGAGPERERLCERSDFLYVPGLNAYMGRVTLQAEIRACRPESALSAIDDKNPSESVLQQDFLTSLFYNRTQTDCLTNIPALSADQLSAFLKDGVRGTCVLCADLNAARMLVDAFGDVQPDVCFGAQQMDLRGFQALCCYPSSGSSLPHRRVILAGLPDFYRAPDAAQCYRFDCGCAMKADLPDRDAVREVYRALRAVFASREVWYTQRQLVHLLSAFSHLPALTCHAAMWVLHEMELVDYAAPQCALRPMRKIGPEASAYFNQLTQWKNA